MSNPNGRRSSSTEVSVSSDSESEEVVCGVCLTDQLELPVNLPCNHIFCGTCIKPWLEKERRICPFCKRQIQIDLGKLKILDKLMDKMQVAEEVNCPVRWQYAGRNFGYWDYSPSSNLFIEQQYQLYQKAVSTRQYPIQDSETDDSNTESYSFTDSDKEESDQESDIDEEIELESDDSSNHQVVPPAPPPSPVPSIPPAPQLPSLNQDQLARLEREKIRALRNCEFEVGPTVYVIDFRYMTQYPKDNPGRTRSVQRVAKGQHTSQTCKGTAGIEKVFI